MSIYDNIKTAADLIAEVKQHGISTATEDICRAQDIFGHATPDELQRLATDNGKRDADGLQDQYGSWTSGSSGTQQTFYQIIFIIWGWERATAFWNDNSNPHLHKYRTLAAEAEETAKRQEDENLELQEQIKEQHDELLEFNQRICDSTQRIEGLKDVILEMESQKMKLKATIQEMELQNMKLKAKMYDLFVSKEEI